MAACSVKEETMMLFLILLFLLVLRSTYTIKWIFSIAHCSLSLSWPQQWVGTVALSWEQSESVINTHFRDRDLWLNHSHTQPLPCGQDPRGHKQFQGNRYLCWEKLMKKVASISQGSWPSFSIQIPITSTIVASRAPGFDSDSRSI